MIKRKGKQERPFYAPFIIMTDELKIKLAIQSLEKILHEVRFIEKSYKTESIRGDCEFTIKALKDETK